MHTVVASHGHCFDGLASAALFTNLLRELGEAKDDFVYRAVGYSPDSKQHVERIFTGKVNALLDYRFSPSPSLSWYFDHHRTAFSTPADEDVFAARRGEGRFYYDAACSSCSKLIYQTSKEHFGVSQATLQELMKWADVIDSASFPDPEAAIDNQNPILRLANVVEHHGDDKFYGELVPQLLTRPVLEVAQSKVVTDLYEPLAGRREVFLRLVKQHARTLGHVVFVDLTVTPLQTLAKFVTYALFPQSQYSVIIGRLGNAIKISVGHNPWSGKALQHDIGAMCARHGGGGHAMVGGIAFHLAELDRALSVATEIARELDGSPRPA
jgi:hypothetical protein